MSDGPVSETARRIGEALRSLAPSGVRTAARAIDVGDVGALRPGERAAVAGAVASRRAEFASGRVLLRELIGTDSEILVGAGRRPDLPAGVIGTLAHDRDIAVAATTTHASCRALGVDIELATVLAAEEARLILRPEERELDACLVFVLKEAVYKAWSSLGGAMLDHHDVAVDVDEPGGAFTAIVGPGPTVPSAWPPDRVGGRYLAVEGRYVALVVVDGPLPVKKTSMIPVARAPGVVAS